MGYIAGERHSGILPPSLLGLRGGGKSSKGRKAGGRSGSEARKVGGGGRIIGKRPSLKGAGLPRLGGPPQGVSKVRKKLQVRRLAGVSVPLPKHAGARQAPPLVVAVIPVTRSADAHAACESISAMCETKGGSRGPSSGIDTHTLLLPASWGGGPGRRITMLPVKACDPEGMLDACKVSDHVLVLFAGQEMPPSAGEEDPEGVSTALALLRAHGVPSVHAIAQGVEGVSASKREHLRRERGRVLEAESMGEQHEMRTRDLGEEGQVSALLRSLCGKLPKGLPWRVPYSYMVASKAVFEPADGASNMCVYGYVRGVPLSANDLVHVTGVGSFEVEVVEMAADPCPSGRTKGVGREGASQVVFGDGLCWWTVGVALWLLLGVLVGDFVVELGM